MPDKSGNYITKKMKFEAIDFYYFSGTGNTLLVVKKMRDVFVKNKINTNLYKIEKTDPKKINPNFTIGLAFPVECFSTFPFVWKFLKSLPSVNGTDIFMVDTLGGASGGIVGPLKKILIKKGYNPIGAAEIQMPANIFYVQKESNNRKKIEKGLLKAENYAADLINGKSKWCRVPILSDIVYFASTALTKLFDWQPHQKWFLFKVDKSKCTRCGICTKLCPVSNIEMQEYPVYGMKCQYCLRCVSFCPEQSIPCFFNHKGKPYRAVNSGELL
ncbi:MAG: EFR1 family ferrodoxin [Elusimicrobiota bacterium]